MSPNRVAIDRWLVDLHAVERQAVAQLGAASGLPASPELADLSARHLEESRRHLALVESCLRSRRGHPSPLHDLLATANRLGFFLYTVGSSDSPGKLLADSFAYEFFEIAAYRMLAHAAGLLEDEGLRTVARQILGEEEEMSSRLARLFERVLEQSDAHGQRGGDSIIRHLRDVHALESQAVVLLRGAARMSGPELRGLLRTHAAEAAAQRTALGDRLRKLGRSPSPVKAATMGLAGAAWALVWTLQRDTRPKLACFAYAERHLQIASYQLLLREAARAGDEPTRLLAQRHLGQEQAGADSLSARLERVAAGSM